MELTLALAQADAAKVARFPAIREARTGRARAQAVRIVWHDFLDRALAEAGLALAEQRGMWRLERTRPEPTTPWPPATDCRPVAEGEAPDTLGHPLPELIAPVAAFEGKRTIIALTLEDEAVSVTLLDGVLRAVAAERSVARLILSGPDRVVTLLARALAEALPLAVPPRSLAMEAMHLADGGAPVPRRSGAPALPADGFTIREAAAHILGHLADVILSLAPLVADAATGTEPVHQMRVAVRRARSALALFQPVIDEAVFACLSSGLRQLGHVVGPARDWDVFMTETAPPVEAALPRQAALHALHALLRAGARRRIAARTALGAWLESQEFRLLSLDLACFAATARAEADEPSLPEFAAAAIGTCWKKMLKSGKSLRDLDDDALHEVRLKAKRLRYAAEFFAPLFAGKPASRFIRRLAVLQERMGVFNDAAGAETLLGDLSSGLGHAGGLVLGFTAARGAGIRPKIAGAWERLRRRDPFWV